MMIAQRPHFCWVQVLLRPPFFLLVLTKLSHSVRLLPSPKRRMSGINFLPIRTMWLPLRYSPSLLTPKFTFTKGAVPHFFVCLAFYEEKAALLLPFRPSWKKISSTYSLWLVQQISTKMSILLSSISRLVEIILRAMTTVKMQPPWQDHQDPSWSLSGLLQRMSYQAYPVRECLLLFGTHSTPKLSASWMPFSFQR